MKCFEEVRAVSEVSRRFPVIMSSIIPFPFYKVLMLVAVLTTVEDAFYFIFDVIVDFNWFWWWGFNAIDIIAYPGREAIDMEDRVLPH
jgi:hypothetical protein